MKFTWDQDYTYVGVEENRMEYCNRHYTSNKTLKNSYF